MLIIMLQMDPEHDRKISEHVLRIHRYRNPGEQDGEGTFYTHTYIHVHIIIIYNICIY